MNYVFYATFPAGLDKQVIKLLYKNIKKTRILEILDGAILFECSNISVVSRLKFFNNTHIVLNLAKHHETELSKKALKNLININEKKLNINFKYENFKFFYKEINQLAYMKPEMKQMVEEFIKKKFCLVHKKSAQKFEEFLVLTRSEGISMFLYRMRKNNNRHLAKGELRSELANIIISLSNPNKDDIVLDPFAGFGGLACERVKMPFKKLVIRDINPGCISQIKTKLKSINALSKLDILLSSSDFLTSDIEYNYYTKIITDPPWGIFEKIENIDNFYKKILGKIFLILKQNGLAIILTSRDIDLKKLVKEIGLSFKIIEQFKILLSGKKASLYKLEKQ